MFVFIFPTCSPHTSKEIIFIGDFNINYSNKKSGDTKKLIGWQNKLGLHQIIKRNTRVSSRSQSLIDLIITNVEYCDSSGVIDLHISDHQPVYLVKKKPKDKRSKVCFKGRTYIGYNKDILSDSLTNEIKNSFRQTINPNNCWDLMEDFLTKFLDEHCPLKTFRSKENSPAWISHDIITLSKDRDTAWVKARSTNNADDWEIARRLRNWSNNAIKAAKADYIQGQLEENKKDPKKFWRSIKQVLSDNITGLIDIKGPLNNESLPKNQQAQVINDFFTGIGEKLAVQFDDIRPQPVNAVDHNDTLEVQHITQVEVLKLLDSISVNKSSGLDNVSSRVLKDFLVLASRELTCLYNNILGTGIFPDKWKIATVTFLFLRYLMPTLLMS